MKRLGWGLVYTLFGAILVLLVLIAFRNPDMTRTRLLIEFWPYYLLSMTTAFVAYGIVTRWR